MQVLELNMLPESCVAEILSLTSPSDACRSSLVSITFRSAADSDYVWGKFLPSEYHESVWEACDASFQFCSKKELYFLLCNPLLVGDGKMSFRLERSSGRMSYIISARELSITWSNDPMLWVWKSIPESRFSEVAELVTTSWLEINGKITTKMLSPNTNYGAYLILKTTERSFGLDLIPCETSIEIGSRTLKNTAYMRCQDAKKQQIETLFYSNRKEMMKSRVVKGDDGVMSKREDGWMEMEMELELELGEFFNGGFGDERVKMSLMEIKGHQLKGGVTIEGIEIRPKK
ncbi:F-box protein PP2-B15-like [Hibiscus syriacus]|uniref:F-box protein PP2-B15-like n=1 Tax=Hibiscus syriacus TaxID=106335 RepID=UPI001920CFD8|nr:F-box protein PP2-B15-like [Hibiscus syriacus]